jgi:hypothetical protein
MFRTLLVAARGNTVAYRFHSALFSSYWGYVQGFFGQSSFESTQQFMENPFELFTVTTDGHAYMLQSGNVRSYERPPPNEYPIPVPWLLLGTSRAWPGFLFAPRLVAQDGRTGLVFFSFMYPNGSVSVVHNSIARNSSWTPLSFPIVANGSHYMFSSSLLDGPTLKLSNTGKLYMLVLDAGCSVRNASVLRLVDDRFEFVGQRCFCNSAYANLVVPDDGFPTMVVDASTPNAIWQYSTSDDRWRIIASRFTFKAQSLLAYATLPNSTNLVAIGSIPYGRNYLFFNNCTNRFESQSEYDNSEWPSTDAPIQSLSDDGRPFVMFHSRPNPRHFARAPHLTEVLVYEGDIPIPERMTACVACPSSMYGTNSTCISCPVNFEPAPSGRCAQCGQGWYSNGGSHACACAPGYVYFPSTEVCAQCSGDTYQDGNNCFGCPWQTPKANANKTACLPCPAGTYTSQSQGCVSCLAGSYTSEPGLMQCLSCPAGTHSPNPGATACVPSDASLSAVMSAGLLSLLLSLILVMLPGH